MANEDRLPQFDRAKIKTPIGFFSTLFRLMRISEEFAIPAIVKEYDRNTGIVKVQPLVSNLADDINNQEVEIPRSEYEVHVVRFAHGGYVVDAPLFVGDTGWLIAGDRNSTSAIKANSTILEEDQTDKNSPNEGYKKPDDNSLKSFAWGFFIPDTWGITDFTDEDGLVVRGQRISVESDHVTVECGENSASISKESINIDTEKCNIEIKEDYASVISERYSAKIDGNGAIVEGPNDKISIGDNGLHHEGVIDEKRDIISAIEYDEEIGDLIRKSFSVSKRGDLIVDIDEETDWERLGLPNPLKPPFTVRWAPNEIHPSQQGGDAGSWVIWLPDLYQVAWDGDGSLAPSAGTTLTPCATLPSGWYMIGRVRPQDSEVWVGYNSSLRTYGLSRSASGLSQPYMLIATMDTNTKAVTQYVDSALIFSDEDDAPVVPDDVSTEFIPDPPSGTTPDGDEGELQIKGFKSGQPADTNSIAEYLMGTAQISGQVCLIVRSQSTGRGPVLGYLPLSALNLYEYAKKTDLPIVNDGTLTIKQGTTTLGTFTANQATPATVTIPEPPTPPTVNDGTLTLNLGSLTKTFTANQAANETITVPAKTIVAGSNVAISVSGNTLTISATGGGSTSGFTGTRRTLALTRYDISTNQLQAKYFTETWSNGLMTASTIDSAWSMIEGGQAVVETV